MLGISSFYYYYYEADSHDRGDDQEFGKQDEESAEEEQDEEAESLNHANQAKASNRCLEHALDYRPATLAANPAGGKRAPHRPVRARCQ